MDVLFRVHPSPVPTQTTFGFFGSTVTAPIDCTGCLSKTGLNVVPPLTDFHTPPLAAPMYTVRRCPSWTASRAATRPLMVADPMLRAPSPEIVSESTLMAGVCASAVVVSSRAAKQALLIAHLRGEPSAASSLPSPAPFSLPAS